MRRIRKITNVVPVYVVGVGGSGCNTVQRLLETHTSGVEMVAMHTDAAALSRSEAPRQLLLGVPGSSQQRRSGDPAYGARSAHLTTESIQHTLKRAELVFITCGLGGGTGTGAAPVIARIARDAGALTVGVVTEPFAFEGAQRMQVAEDGIRRLQQAVDTLIVIPNSRLTRTVDQHTPLVDALRSADQVIGEAIQGITDLLNVPGYINLDFADVRSVMKAGGLAVMSVGRGTGPDRAVEATQTLFNTSLLGLTLDGAQAMVLNFSVSPDVGLPEVQEAADRIREKTNPNVNLFFGVTLDPMLHDEMRIMMIGTGYKRIVPDHVVTRRVLKRALPAQKSAETPLEISPIQQGAVAAARGKRRITTVGQERLVPADLTVPAFLRR